MSHYLQGAEPVYLHVMRPLIKPYSTTVDALLETASLIGDFMLLLLAWPKHAFMSWYHRWTSLGSDEDDDLQSLSSSNALSHGAHPSLTGSQPLQTRSRSRTIHEDASRAAAIIARLHVSQPSESDPANTFEGHRIWYPPPPAYDEHEQSDVGGLHQFSSTARLDAPQLSVDVGSVSNPLIQSFSPDYVDEWRKYPDFPSAYPPTPIAPPKSLRIIAPVPKRPSDVIQFVNISEEDESSDSQVEETGSNKIDGLLREKRDIDNSDNEKEGIRSDFRESLLKPCESMNPDSDKHLGDDTVPTVGVQIKIDEGSPDEDETMDMTLKTPRALRQEKGGEDVDVDMEVSDVEQDSFDFKTPKPLRVNPDLLKPRPQSMLSTASTSSWQSKSTTLSTNDGGSSLRTQTGSESDSSKPVSDSLSVAGRKRPFPPSRDSQSTVRGRSRAPTMSRSSSSGDAVPVARPGVARTRVRRVVTTDDENYEGESETDCTSDASSVTKKRRTIGPIVASRPRKNASSRPSSAVSLQKATRPTDTMLPTVRRSTRSVAPKDTSSAQAGRGKARHGTAGSRW
jgi:hypothetical protein